MKTSLTSLDFSPKIALNSFSSAVNSVSPFGEIYLTNISPGFTCAPILITIVSSRFLSIFLPLNVVFLVIS